MNVNSKDKCGTDYTLEDHIRLCGFETKEEALEDVYEGMKQALEWSDI